MTISFALLLFAVVVMSVAPRVLVDAGWVRAAPRLGIALWQACSAAVLSAVLLLAVTATAPVHRVSFDVEHLLHACAAVLKHRYDVHALAWIAGVSAAIAGTAGLLLARAAIRRGVSVLRSRTRQRDLLDLVAHDLDANGAHVLPLEVPLAYCIPGRRGRIVLTTATKAQLGEEQIAAVMAHERAHLRGRHDLVLFGADVTRTAFPWSRFFSVARDQTAGLVEMAADDRAARTTGALPVATALIHLGTRAAPDGVLAAAGTMTAERVARLLGAARGPSRARRVGAAAICLSLLALPWVIALAPAWAASAGRCLTPGV